MAVIAPDSPSVSDQTLPLERVRQFVPLDPWIEPPEPRFLRLASVDFWRTHHLLPLLLGPRGLRVVDGGDASPDLLGELRRQVAQPIEVVYGAREEVDFWLDVLLGSVSWSEALVTSIGELLEQLGMGAESLSPLQEGADNSLGVESIARSFGLTEDVAMEALALVSRRAHLRLERYQPSHALSALLPVELATELRTVPVLVHGGVAVLASPSVFGRHILRRLQQAVGLDIRVCVCTPSAFERAFQAVYTPDPAQQAPPTDDATVLRHLHDLGVLDQTRGDALARIARTTGETQLAAARRLGYVQEHDVQRALARALDIPAAAEGALRANPELAAHGAPVLWTRWRCVPLERHGGTEVRVVTDRPLPDNVLACIGYLLDCQSVAQLYALPEHMERALRNLPAAHTEPYQAEEHLLAAGMVLPRRLAEAHRRMAREDLSMREVLLSGGLVSPEDLVEARSVALNRAWVHLARYEPKPGVASLVPEGLARAEFGVALRKHGRSLTFALLNGRDNPTPGLLEHTTGLAIDPVLAVVDDPERAFERWYHADEQPLPEGYEAFGNFLTRRQSLLREVLDQAWAALRRGERLEDALTARGRLTPDQLVSELCAYLGLERVSLEPVERDVEYIDALGRPRRERTWGDPIDHAVARRLPGAQGVSVGCIPVREVDGAVLVAFANPLERASIQEISALLGRPVRLLVATRREIEVAQNRVYARKSVGERLLEAGAITRDQLNRALRVHDQTGVRIGQVLVNLGFLAEDELAATLAEQAGLIYLDVSGVELDPFLMRRVPADLERERRVLPLYDDGQAVLVACADVPDEPLLETLTEQLGRPVQPAIVTTTAVTDALTTFYRDEYVEQSASYLVSRAPDDSAAWVLTRAQKVFLWAVCGAIVIGLGLATIATITVLISLATCFYVAFSLYKFYLAYKAITHTLEVATSDEEVAALDDRELPIYTILVPVYKEAEVFPILSRAIERLDYPKAKLDVKILLEEDDAETIEVARKSNLPSHFKLVVVPKSQPRGKPKACNFGLIHAEGEFVVIYDAEDIPEPDQLKKALVAFRKGDEQLACIQGKLNYFNRGQNLLTRWFTTEYSMWFDIFLPGLDASDAPIPLGGTSNHFKTDRLRELGAWDPHNVTEDADLGMRLYKAGWKTAVIDSTTYEEANSEVMNWIRQRSRWVKGYIQTYLVHMRHPVRLYRQLGFRAFMSFQLVIGGTFFGFLVNPLFWLLTALWFVTKWGVIREVFPAPIFYIGALGLYFGNFVFTYLNVAGCLRREYWDMVKYALLSPLYWALMSIAAWKGFLQLFYAPSYWEKTQHGLYKAPANGALIGGDGV